MPYRFVAEDRDYTDFSAGRVLMGRPGLPAFPVRLASEMFQRARSHLPHPGPVTLYDPTCGGAYHLAALGFLHDGLIRAILASDIDARAVELAQHNLALLHSDGLTERESEIRRMWEAYGKPSHRDALESVQVLRRMRAEQGGTIETVPGTADALDPQAIRAFLDSRQVDLVLSDLPYGNLSAWQVSAAKGQQPVWHLLDALLPNLIPGAVVALAADKKQGIAHEGYRRLERFQIGKRQITILTPGT